MFSICSRFVLLTFSDQNTNRTEHEQTMNKSRTVEQIRNISGTFKVYPCKKILLLCIIYICLWHIQTKNTRLG